MHPLVDVQTLAAHLDDPTWVVFDCRHDLMKPASGAEAYATAHIPHARFASLDEVLSGPKAHGLGRHPLPDREAFVAFLADAGVNADSTIVGYDASNGLYAARLWWLARSIGHAKVAVLDGGLPAWQQAGLALTDVPPPTATRGNIVAKAALTKQVDTAELVAHLAAGTRLVVDSRAPERYRGDVEPLDPVAGHIPGAVNHPMARLLAADGRFKSPAELRSGFDALRGNRAVDEIVHSCGSGVTASLSLLAMEVAGLTGAELYPPSWSGWIADPERGVAKGDGKRDAT
jgi:thiosulfate/3-mercaptopyruvate sulfurtransferase